MMDYNSLDSHICGDFAEECEDYEYGTNPLLAALKYRFGGQTLTSSLLSISLDSLEDYEAGKGTDFFEWVESTPADVAQAKEVLARLMVLATA